MRSAMSAWARALVVLCAWSAAAGGAGGARPPELGVPLCCGAGRTLAPATAGAPVLSAAAAAAACRPADPPVVWAPRVYAPAKADFLKRLPAYFRFTNATMPDCDEMRVLPEHAAPYALLANNGSLWLRGAATSLPTDRYCVDSVAALVCLEDVPFPPSKCCHATGAFDGSRCVEDEERARGALEELRQLANGTALGSGWPACGEGSRYAEAGALAGARLLPDGALALADARLAAGAWCADAVVGAEAAGARVLACEAAARAPSGRGARHLLYGAGLAVGAAFLAATLAAGFALPAAHHALHWRCQTHYVAALMLGDVLLAGTQLAGDQVPPALCRALGESLS